MVIVPKGNAILRYALEARFPDERDIASVRRLESPREESRNSVTADCVPWELAITQQNAIDRERGMRVCMLSSHNILGNDCHLDVPVLSTRTMVGVPSVEQRT